MTAALTRPEKAFVMKRIFIILAATAAVLSAAVSCTLENGEEMPPVLTEENGITISINGVIGDFVPAESVKSSAATVVRVFWETTDKVYVYDGSSCLGQLKVELKDGDARYAFLSNDGVIATPAPGTEQLTLIHFSGATPVVSGNKITVDFSTQAGSDFPFVLYATLPYTSGQISCEGASVPFEFATSVLKINWTGFGSGDVTDAVLSGVSTVCELTLSPSAGPQIEGTSAGAITRSNGFNVSGGKGTVSMGVVKSAESVLRHLTVRATDGTYDATFAKGAFGCGKSLNTICEMHRKPVDQECVFIAGVYWAKQNLFIQSGFSGGSRQWKNDAGGAVSLPGSDNQVRVGDFFQWGAYTGYCGASSDDDKGLLTYSGFNCPYIFGEGSDSYFTFKAGKSFSKACTPYYDGSSYTKYTSRGGTLDPTDDVASLLLGGEWRIPAKSEFEALAAVTYWKWDAADHGYYVYAPSAAADAGKVNGTTAGSYSKSDALLFFPASGYGDDESLSFAGSMGFYWSSTSSDQTGKYALYFNSSGIQTNYSQMRYAGQPVRPVSD